MDAFSEIEAISSPLAEDEHDETAANKRKSGRSIRKPVLFSQEMHSIRASNAEKRKRGAPHDDDEGDEEDDEEDASESEDEEEEEEPDEEEAKERRRAARKAAARKKMATKDKGNSKTSRAAKKPKINGAGKQLAIRSLTNGKKKSSSKRKEKPQKKKRTRKAEPRPIFAALTEGIFVDIFDKGQAVDTVIEEWISQYETDPVDGLHKLFNFALMCTGANLSVDKQDVTDEDLWPERLDDLQEAHLEQEPSDYPLISKEKKFRTFKSTIADFFDSWAETLHRSSLLYNNDKPCAKFQVWLGSMSSAGNRAFRHTATVMALTLGTALCDVTEGITSTLSTSRKQLESEKRKKTANKGRINVIQSTIQESEEKLETIDDILRDDFDVVWVQRYRDVEPKIRAECVFSLSRWIQTYREMFFESQYVRYLGWGLSDMVTYVRAAVVGQLRQIYESKWSVAALRTFTGRFLRRMVEMALKDADVAVRASTVELLDLIRDMGLLENEDVDTVGQLVFDAEPRIRKVAGRFFAANLQELFDANTEEMAEDINEVFADEDEEDFESPKRSWIKFKCLVDILQAYDGQKDQSKSDRQVGTIEALSGAPVESRFFLATEAIYPHMEELEQWQSLAGYLLYDHSQITDSPPQDEASNVRNFYALEEGQDIILLEVLVCAVKLRILEVTKSDIDKRGRKIKSLTDKIPELQEEIAHNLTQIIPQLLNKFGAVPEAASAVLRLEHLVDLNMIQDLQKDATAYSSLLHDINKQFLTHSNQDVLAEASVAFLHARSSDEMKEAMEGKVQELWDDMIDALGSLSQNKDVQSGSSIRVNILTDLANTVTRIFNLASITDCVSIMETMPSATARKRKQNFEAPFNTLIHLAKRGLRDEDPDEDTANLETELVVNSIKSLLFYFMWKIQALSSAVKSGNVPYSTAYFEALVKSRDIFVFTLKATIQQRSILDDIRFAAITTLLDVQTLFGTLRHIGSTIKGGSEAVDEDVILQTQSLAHEIDADTEKTLVRFHDIAERAFAKKLKRDIGPAAIDDAPLNSAQDLKDIPSDDEEEEEEEDEDDGANESAANERLRATILTEQRLCELTGKMVLAIIGRVLDTSGSQRGKLKQKLLKNKSRLGHNYREVIAFLDERKNRSASRPVQSKAKPPNEANKGKEAAAKSTERVEESDEEEAQPEGNAQAEEYDDEDLRARELVEDNADDDDDEELSSAPPDQEENDDQDRDENEGGDEDEDEVMGD